MTVEDHLRSPIVPADHRLPYGSDPSQFGDLYLPSSPEPHRVVVMLHGGCWRDRYGLDPLGTLCRALANVGFAVWSLEYRRLGNGGGWPLTFVDVSAGTEFLRGISERFRLDLTRVVTAGHSAGGHLALWLAARHRLPADSVLFEVGTLPVRGVVSLAGITDLAEGCSRHLCGGACHEFLGGFPDEVPLRYRHASPREMLPIGVPQLHIVGSEDQLVPAEYVREYVTVAARHEDVRLEILPGAGHFELVAPSPKAWTAITRSVSELFAP